MINRFTPIAFALLRIVSGLLFACHGGQKLLGMFGGPPHPVAGALMTTGAVIELVGGFLIAFGLLTRVAAFISSGEMAVGYFMAHAPGGFFPIVNHGELAVVYAFLFLFISAHGGGRWSIDALWMKSESAPKV
jgi:putative oxidoreductase